LVAQRRRTAAGGCSPIDAAIAAHPSRRPQGEPCISYRTGIRAPAPAVSLCAASAQSGREHSPGTSMRPALARRIESCKQQSSSAAGGGLTAGIGQRRPRPVEASAWLHLVRGSSAVDRRSHELWTSPVAAAFLGRQSGGGLSLSRASSTRNLAASTALACCNHHRAATSAPRPRWLLLVRCSSLGQSDRAAREECSGTPPATPTDTAKATRPPRRCSTPAAPISRPPSTVSHELLSSKHKSSSLPGTARTAASGQDQPRPLV
jgi:hypothetical protein